MGAMEHARPNPGTTRSVSTAEADYVGHMPALRSFFARRLRNPQLADDLVQDVMVRMHARKGTAPIENLEAYIFQTASSVLRDHVRRERVRGVVIGAEPADFENIGVELGPDRVLQAKDEIARVVQALNELPERTRDIFLMRRYEGLAYSDIACRIGISVSALEKHMAKAVAHLAHRLGK